MSPYNALAGCTRRLSTAVSASSSAFSAKLTTSQTKNRLRNTHDFDEVLKIYSSSAAAAAALSASSTTARFLQEMAVRRLSKSHRLSDIKHFLDSQKSSPQIAQEPFISSLIRSYGPSRMLQSAVNAYNEMAELHHSMTSLSFNSLLHACVKSKAFDRVPAYFEEYPSKFGFEPDKYSYGILIKAYCEMSSPDAAMEKLREMEEKGIELSVYIFSTILDALYNKGSVKKAKKFWDVMVNAKGILPNAGCYNVRLSHIHRRNLSAVKAMMEEMEKASIKPDTITYNYLITSYCANGMMDEAIKVYDEDMMKGKGPKPNWDTFRTLVSHLCKEKQFVMGYELFKKSVDEQKIPDFNTLKCLVEGLARDGYMDEAKALVRTMNEKLRPNLLRAWGKVAGELDGLSKTGKGGRQGEIKKVTINLGLG